MREIPRLAEEEAVFPTRFGSGEGGAMKSRGTVLVLMVTLLLASVAPLAAAPDKANKPVTCHIDWELNLGTLTYEGEVTGCLEGNAISFVNAARFPGSTEHWVGGTVIFPDDGGVIAIEEKGVWNLLKPRSGKVCPDEYVDEDDNPRCFKYRANGQVVEELYRLDGDGNPIEPPFETSVEYEGLIGARTHGMGYTNFTLADLGAVSPPFLAEQILRIN
jgi:hypothetical protein